MKNPLFNPSPVTPRSVYDFSLMISSPATGGYGVLSVRSADGFGWFQQENS